ncbi:MAG: hypothetical protein FD150_606 [Rhodobacteraceae bacterium]|nr:MAG: hypothetical protein FD150_606 [Paracoccaceae bacterium]
MSRLSLGFLAGAAVLALALASIQVQLVRAGSLPSDPSESTSAPVAADGDAHSGH